MSGQWVPLWGPESGFIGWIPNLQDVLIELVHENLDTLPCIRVLAPFGHFTFVYILWLSNSLLSLSALELALGNSRWHCQVSITSRRSYLFLVVSMTCCECRKRKLSRCFEMLRNLRKHSADLLKQFRKATAAGSAPILDTTNEKITCL